MLEELVVVAGIGPGEDATEATKVLVLIGQGMLYTAGLPQLLQPVPSTETHTHTHTILHDFVCVYMCVCMCVYTLHLWAAVCLRVIVSPLVCMCVYVCVHACVCVCVCVYLTSLGCSRSASLFFSSWRACLGLQAPRLISTRVSYSILSFTSRSSRESVVKLGEWFT